MITALKEINKIGNECQENMKSEEKFNQFIDSIDVDAVIADFKSTFDYSTLKGYKFGEYLVGSGNIIINDITMLQNVTTEVNSGGLFYGYKFNFTFKITYNNDKISDTFDCDYCYDAISKNFYRQTIRTKFDDNRKSATALAVAEDIYEYLNKEIQII